MRGLRPRAGRRLACFVRPHGRMPQLLLRFCVLGSFVGSGVFVVARDLATSNTSVPSIDSPFVALLKIPFWALMSSFLSIPLAFVPGTVAALLHLRILRRYTDHNPRPLVRVGLGSVLGCVSSAIFGGLLFSSSSGPGAYSSISNLAAWAAAGIVGGAVAALASGERTYQDSINGRPTVRGA